MRTRRWILVVALFGSPYVLTAGNSALHNRRQGAAVAFHDGILRRHAKSKMEFTADGFRQDPIFYYVTGLGPMLADRTEAGPLPPEEMVAISKQIIEGLRSTR